MDYNIFRIFVYTENINFVKPYMRYKKENVNEIN